MADTPPFGIRFKRPRLARPSDFSSVLDAVKRATQKPLEGDIAPNSANDRVPLYDRAVELAARAHEVIERAEAERFFLRDQLDRKSSMVPQLIAQGLAVADMHARRTLFRHARRALTDCATIFDLLVERGSAPPDAVDAARALCLALLDELVPLIAEPPKQW